MCSKHARKYVWCASVTFFESRVRKEELKSHFDTFSSLEKSTSFRLYQENSELDGVISYVLLHLSYRYELEFTKSREVNWWNEVEQSERRVLVFVYGAQYPKENFTLSMPLEPATAQSLYDNVPQTSASFPRYLSISVVYEGTA